MYKARNVAGSAKPSSFSAAASCCGVAGKQANPSRRGSSAATRLLSSICGPYQPRSRQVSRIRSIRFIVSPDTPRLQMPNSCIVVNSCSKVKQAIQLKGAFLEWLVQHESASMVAHFLNQEPIVETMV